MQIKSPFTQKPTIYIYDNFPGGVGFSEKLYDMEDQLLKAARQVIMECDCEDGCPSWWGPMKKWVTAANLCLKNYKRGAFRLNLSEKLRTFISGKHTGNINTDGHAEDKDHYPVMEKILEATMVNTPLGEHFVVEKTYKSCYMHGEISGFRL